MDSHRFETQFFIGLLVLVSGVMLFILFPVLNSIIFAATFAILFNPVYSKLRKIMPKMESFAALLTVLLATVIILAPLIFFGIRILQEAQGLYAHLSSGNSTPVLELLGDKLQRFAPWLQFDINQALKQILGLFLNNTGLILSNIATVAGTFLLSAIALYYFLKDGVRLRSVILKNSPLSLERTEEILLKLHNMVTSIIGGILLGSIVEGIFVGLGFFAFGLPGAVLWGAVAAVAGLVPVLGVSLVIVPGIISLVLMGSQTGALGFAMLEFAMMIMIENSMKPWLIQRKSKVHPLLILFSIIGGLVVFGPTGLLIGPLIMIFSLTLFEIYPAIILKQK